MNASICLKLAALAVACVCLGALCTGPEDPVDKSAVLLAGAQPAANIDQVRNDAFDHPNCICEWVNGNAGPQQAHYLEGWSIPYRVKMTNLPTNKGKITITLGYDIMEGEKNALDYLTSYNRIDNPPGSHKAMFRHDAEVINPTEGLDFDIAPMVMSTLEIPCPAGKPVECIGGEQPSDSWKNLVLQDERVMTLYGGTLTGIQLKAGDLKDERQVDVTFIPQSTNCVLAWGGHIACRYDWGCPGNPMSAGGINGSPYHMRLKNWTIEKGRLPNLGNQDRSLKATAADVFVPPPVCSVNANEDPVCEGISGDVPPGACVKGSGGEGPLTAEWRDPSGVVIQTCDLGSGGSCCFAVPDPQVSHSGTYTAKVIDARGLESSENCAYTLTVVEPPTAYAGPDQNKCVSETGETCFTLAGSGSSEAAASWTIINRSTSPADCPVSITPPSGSFTPVVCFAPGCTGSADLQIRVPGEYPCPDATGDVKLTVDPCGEGCTPGYWKNHSNRWDGGCNGAGSADDFTTNIQKCDLFNTTLGVTSAQSGCANTTTLLQAVGLGGGGLQALNRHTAAALASADSGIDFPYTVAQIIAMYKDAVGASAGPETVSSVTAKLTAANELGCPLN